MKLAISDITIDEALQSRAKLDVDRVKQFVDVVDELPPVIVFADGSAYWLADGFHRVDAHKRAGRKDVAVEVKDGARRDAVLFAAKANAAHDAAGKPRTNADKKRCVELVIREVPEWGDNRIADHVGVSDPFVAKVRQLLTVRSSADPAEAERLNPAERIGKDGKTRKAKKPKSPPKPKATKPEPQPEPSRAEPTPSPASAPAGPPVAEDLVARVTEVIHEAAHSWPADTPKDDLHRALTRCAKGVEPEDEDEVHVTAQLLAFELDEQIQSTVDAIPSGDDVAPVLDVLTKWIRRLEKRGSA